MQGCTPLYLAAQGGHIDVLKLLLGSGADAVGKSVEVSHVCARLLPCAVPDSSSFIPLYTCGQCIALKS